MGKVLCSVGLVTVNYLIDMGDGIGDDICDGMGEDMGDSMWDDMGDDMG